MIASLLLLLSYLLLMAIYCLLELCNDLLKVNKNVLSIVDEFYVPKVTQKVEEE